MGIFSHDEEPSWSEVVSLQKQIRALNDNYRNLQAENERLKKKVETRDNLVEHFRKESINWAKISNDCIKDIENYKQTLQEIKGITTALYMNEWLQQNETARKSIQLLQEKIAECEVNE